MTGSKRATWDGVKGQAIGAGAFSPDGRTFAAVRINYPGPSTIALIH
jgi:hypothetical protein